MYITYHIILDQDLFDTMTDYISARDAAESWGISQRRVSALCSQGRIPESKIIGNSWMIPANSKKPDDARSRYFSESNDRLKPFIKWAGGKGQLVDQISSMYPSELGKSIKKYVEPFIGGGAILFNILARFSLKEVYISDINRELIRTYVAIRDDPDTLIENLNQYQDEFIKLDGDERKQYFYVKRSRFNELIDDRSDEFVDECAALFIFLNKTCFNGLYRVNSSGHFNVPFGRYKNPLICDVNNILTVSKKLQNVSIINGNFRESFDFIDSETFVYFDPPYRPLSETANFNSYSGEFNDDSQRDLAAYCREINDKDAKFALSNSDPKNTDPNDNFFDDLYAGFNIIRLKANRMINSNGENRGVISEILVTNYVSKSKQIQKTLDE